MYKDLSKIKNSSEQNKNINRVQNCRKKSNRIRETETDWDREYRVKALFLHIAWLNSIPETKYDSMRTTRGDPGAPTVVSPLQRKQKKIKIK